MSRSRTPLAALAVAATLAASGPALAIWEHESDDDNLDLGGSLRTVTAGLQNYDFPLLFGEGNSADGLSQTLLRLTFSGDVQDWYSYEAHVVQGVQFTTSSFAGLGSIGGGGGSTPLRYRAWDLAWDWADSGDLVASFGVDRLNMKLALPYVDITGGRQAINFSEAYFWNPLDVFLAFDPQAFDRDYKAGVDALRFDVALGDFSGLVLVAAIGRELRTGISAAQLQAGVDQSLAAALAGQEPSFDLSAAGGGVSAREFQQELVFGSALILRAFTNLWDWDFAVQGGKVYGGYHVGVGFSGEVLTLGVRGEAAYFIAAGKRTAGVYDPRPAARAESATCLNQLGAALLRPVQLTEDHASAVLGLDRRFESSLYIALEYFYNGAGDDDLDAAMQRLAVGETLSLSEHLLGALVSYEFLPLLTGQIAWMFSASDRSSLLSPSLVYSISDEADLVVGAMLAFGPRPKAREYEVAVQMPLPPEDGVCVEGAPSMGAPLPYPELKSEFGTYPNIYFGEVKFYF